MSGGYVDGQHQQGYAQPWAPVSPARAGRSRPPRWALASVGVAVVVVLVAGIASAVVVATDDPARFPDEWEDPRVAELAEFVEDERGLTFENPVFVDFLSEEEFAEQLTTGENELTDQDREEYEQAQRLLRAAGLVTGSVDLAEEDEALVGEGILGYYAPEDERIRVRGTDLTVGVRATLAHELTHALQDQRLDISRLGEFDSDGQNAAFLAVVEGDASAVEAAYADQLGEEDQARLEEEEAGDLEDANLDEVPGALVAFFSAPYVLGETFVEVVRVQRGAEAIDEAIREPPASEEQLFDPFVYLDGDEPLAVDEPALEPGDERLDGADFGTVTWFLLLAGRIDPGQALEAVDGWGGDAYVGFERDGRTCLRASFRGDSGIETDQMNAALDVFSSTTPGGTAQVTRSGDIVQLESCDPGASVEGPEVSPDVLVYPVARAAFVQTAVEEGATVEEARCLAGAFVTSFSLDELLNLDSEEPEATDDRVEAAARTCA